VLRTLVHNRRCHNHASEAPVYIFSDELVFEALRVARESRLAANPELQHRHAHAQQAVVRCAALRVRPVSAVADGAVDGRSCGRISEAVLAREPSTLVQEALWWSSLSAVSSTGGGGTAAVSGGAADTRTRRAPPRLESFFGMVLRASRSGVAARVEGAGVQGSGLQVTVQIQ
jgi:hypothetical protein